MYIASNLVNNVVKAAFPDFKKRRAGVECCEKVHIGHMYWSGGYCRYYAVVELATMRVAVLPRDNPMRHITDEYMDMRPGFVVVERTYSGMNEYVTVYCHKDNMPVNLNAPAKS